MDSKKKMLEIIKNKCKENDKEIYYEIIKEIFNHSSKYMGGPSEYRKNDIKKIIERNLGELS